MLKIEKLPVHLIEGRPVGQRFGSEILVIRPPIQEAVAQFEILRQPDIEQDLRLRIAKVSEVLRRIESAAEIKPGERRQSDRQPSVAIEVVASDILAHGDAAPFVENPGQRRRKVEPARSRIAPSIGMLRAEIDSIKHFVEA